MSEAKHEGGTAVEVNGLVMQPVLERWECFRLAYLNETQADAEVAQASEWRERAARRGIMWQKQARLAVQCDGRARVRYQRAKAWRAYGKTISA